MRQYILKFLLYFAIALIIVNLLSGQRKDKTELDELTPITIKTEKNDYGIYGAVKLVIENNRNFPVKFSYNCNELPFGLFSSVSNKKAELPIQSELVNCNTKSLKETQSFTINPYGSYKLNLKPWASTLFAKQGLYRFESNVTVKDETFVVTSKEFEIRSRGLFASLWRHALYQPIFNLLAGLIWIFPGHSLGLGIIALTVLMRLILLSPSQKAMREQKKMQEIQPKLDELRKKYKDDQQKLAMETMEIWKKHKVNPMGSCLPILIQFPILLGLFQVVSGGVQLSTQHVLYQFLADFPLDKVDPTFLSIWDLTENSLIVFPIVVGLLQYIQLKMTLTKTAMPTNSPIPNPQQLMTYILPPMVAVFTASLPAGVGLYWGTSTLFAIAQQFVINKKSGKGKNNESTVIEAEIVK